MLELKDVSVIFNEGTVNEKSPPSEGLRCAVCRERRNPARRAQAVPPPVRGNG